MNTGSTFGTIWTNVPTTEAAKQGELKPELKDQSIQTEEEEVPAPVIQIVQFEDLIRIVVKLNNMDEVLSQMGNVLEKLCSALQAHSTEVSNLANYVTRVSTSLGTQLMHLSQEVLVLDKKFTRVRRW